MAERAASDGGALPARLPRGVAKGQALRAILEELLATLPPGAALPSERELAERYGLARMTVRGEVERLTAEGSVYRLHGRGTYVAEPRIAQAGALTSFTEDMLARGQAPGSTVVSSEVVAADGFLAAALEVKPGDRCFRLDRVRTADGRPMAVERAFVPLERFDGIEGVDFADASLFGVLQSRFGVELGDAEQHVVAVAIEPDEAALLGVPEGSPGLRFHTVTRDGDGAPVFHAVSLYPGDRYEVALRQTRE
jgi:GntR family transcriptional regulator